MSCDILPAAELPRFRADYYDRNKPCVIRGLAEQGRYKIFNGPSTISSQCSARRLCQ